MKKSVNHYNGILYLVYRLIVTDSLELNNRAGFAP